MGIELGFNLDDTASVEQLAGVSMKKNRLFIKENIDGDLLLDFKNDFRQTGKRGLSKSRCQDGSGNRRSDMPVGGEDGLMSNAIGLAVKKSVAENRPVKLDEILN